MTWMNDEGFSEEVRMADDASDQELVPGVLPIPEFIQSMTESQRAELAHAILRSLRTSSIAMIVDKLNPLLHIDPVLRLPAEITQEVFAYLDLETLITTTILSKSWRFQALDPYLWKHLFASEGWKADYKRVWDFEEAQRQREAEKQRERKPRARPADAISDVECKSPKKRARDVKHEEDDSYMNIDTTDNLPTWGEQHGHVEADDDEKMDEGGPESQKIDQAETEEQPKLHERVSFLKTLRTASQKETIYPPIKASLLTTEFASSSQINWQYLYKQKRRLEENWKAGRFTNFTLPHPSHPHEAHAECIYTIQYIGNHLVSGSRDRTIRIWNLDTQRLSRPPLRGHDASVLCLQFDSSPSEDIIISGGSDYHIILWQFSTGKMLKKIERAHAESVLNLRFDSRHLITCSKDRTIKVWNRHALLPTDDDYPIKGSSSSARWPPYIIDISDELARQALNSKPLPEYSLLVTLTGHTAAVNAIQVLDNTIVSASGDRHIKVWDIKTGMCIKTVYGHLKGIACVQFDGRRIVSGSSDETVRIFDAVTAAEVACLRGHADLVRTVQARFGDVPSNVKEEEAQARAIDQQFFQAAAADNLEELTKEQWRARNAGSRDVNDIFAYGAKLPPGGGGSVWARIVSGSYDETIIIWTRDTKGKWIPLHQLTQWEAILRAGGQPRSIPAPNQYPQAHQIANGDLRRRSHRQRAAQQNAQQHGAHQGHRQRATIAAAPTQNRTTQGATAAAPQNPTAAPSQTEAQPQTGHVSMPANAGSSRTQQPTAVHQAQTTTSSRTQAATQHGAPPQQPIPHRPLQPTQQAGQAAAAPGATHPPAAAGAGRGGQGQANATATSAQTQAANHHLRIYKLQFCSRRLLCCSVEPIIVGWDFAAGDKEIEIASEFFGEDAC